MRVPHLALLALATIVAVADPASAQRSLVIQSFAADIRVDEDGTVEVVETIRPRFEGSWNGIFRTIPVDYRTDQGFRYRLRLEIEAVTDGDGTDLRYETSRERHYRKLKIWVPGASNATRTVRIRYRVRNALKFFEEHDELYWNVTGDEWEVPIESATARLVLPRRVTDVRATAFTGGYGSREQAADVEVGAFEVSIRTRRRLAFKEGLTAAVAWLPGVVHRPGAVERTADFLRANAMLGMPLLAFFGMGARWYTRGRDPRRRPIAVQYDPPPGTTPAELGTLVDHSVDMRDVTATLVDLAVRGYLVIEEVGESKFLGLLKDTDYLFELRKAESEWASLAGHERKLLGALFAGEFYADIGDSPQRVRLSSLKNKFYRDLPGIKSAIHNRLVEGRQYASRPDRVRGRYIALGVAAAILVGAGAFLLDGGFPVAGIVSAALTGLIIAAFGWAMPARTRTGVRTLEHTLGFEEFLRRVESDRFDRVIKTPELFEKYLPYAMALGVDTNWARAFADIYDRQPDWYRGGSFQTFSSDGFVRNLGRMSTETAAVMVSAPRSSSGSAFGGGGGGGGGFSGGGFGGGGGGGF